MRFRFKNFLRLILLFFGAVLVLILLGRMFPTDVGPFVGKTENEVRTLLGSPMMINSSADFVAPTHHSATYWYYPLPLDEDCFDSKYRVIVIDRKSRKVVDDSIIRN
jgi:hypothetical protein